MVEEEEEEEEERAPNVSCGCKAVAAYAKKKQHTRFLHKGRCCDMHNLSGENMTKNAHVAKVRKVRTKPDYLVFILALYLSGHTYLD